LSEVLFYKQFEITSRDFEHGGEASSQIKETVKRLGIPSSIVKRIAVASYEAEMNLVVHSSGGTILLEVYPEKIRVVAGDCGPGIEDISLAMKEGYSTAAPEIREMGFGAGMGLPNIQKNADRLEIHSKMGECTTLEFEIDLGEAL